MLFKCEFLSDLKNLFFPISRKISFCCILFSFIFCHFAIAETFKAIPPIPKNSYVFDENRLLSAQETKIFNAIAEDLFRQTGVGIAAAILKNIQGEDARDYAFRIADAWKIGSSQSGGVLIFVTLDEKRRSVEVGYALESILPDALCERLQQETLIPHFRQGKYATGILLLEYKMAETIAKAYGKQLNPKLEESLRQTDSAEVSPWFMLIFVVILVLLISTPGGRSFLYVMCLMALSGGRGGYGSNGRDSRGGFGGGFGGGSFGGGGSGGSW